VQLVEVDAIGAQAAQRVLHGAADVNGSRPALVALVGNAELGGHADLIAAGAEGGPEVLLAQCPPVNVRGVEQGDAGVECGPDNGVGLLPPHAHPEVVAPQTHHADRE
jgi:hypothetical protein